MTSTNTTYAATSIEVVACGGTRMTVSAPARIDLAGGWLDTPPICYEAGGVAEYRLPCCSGIICPMLLRCFYAVSGTYVAAYSSTTCPMLLCSYYAVSGTKVGPNGVTRMVINAAVLVCPFPVLCYRPLHKLQTFKLGGRSLQKNYSIRQLHNWLEAGTHFTLLYFLLPLHCSNATDCTLLETCAPAYLEGKTSFAFLEDEQRKGGWETADWREGEADSRGEAGAQVRGEIKALTPRPCVEGGVTVTCSELDQIRDHDNPAAPAGTKAYAMSGTEIPYSVTYPPTDYYAMCGTDIAYGAAPPTGTEKAYGPTPPICDVRDGAMPPLCDVRY
eukprot:377694-Rhodomonas_salina.1